MHVMGGTMNTEQTARMHQINSELRDLCAEVESLQARALHRVEELENDFHGTPLPSDVKERFCTMRRLVSRV